MTHLDELMADLIVDGDVEGTIALEETCEAIGKDVKKKPIDELCSCGHSKKSHTPHELDSYGGRCGQCKCEIYEWREFVFAEEILKILRGESK